MFWDIVIFAAIGIYAAIIVLGCVVWQSNPTKRSHAYFFIFSLLFSVWLSANLLGIWLTNETLSTIFLLVDFFIATFLCLYLFLFLNEFPKKRIPTDTINLLLLHLPAAAASALLLWGLVITDIAKIRNKLIFTEGPFFLFYEIVIAFYVFGGIGLALINYFQLEGLRKNQIKIILAGFGIVFVSLFIGNIYLQTIIDPKQFVLINLSSVVLPIAITAAVLRHRFMGLKTVYRTFSVFFVLFIFTTLYIHSVFVTGTLAEKMFNLDPIIIFAFFSAFFVPLFIFVREQMIALSELLFSSKINPKNIFNEILKGLSEIDDRPQRIHTLLEKIELVLGSEPTLVLFTDENSCQNHGKPLKHIDTEEVSGICQKAYMLDKTIIRDELKYISLMPGGEQERLFQTLEKQNLEIIVPIKQRGEETFSIVGAIIMHRKPANLYSMAEIAFLEMLTPQLAPYL